MPVDPSKLPGAHMPRRRKKVADPAASVPSPPAKRMWVKQIRAKNFRVFGDGSSAPALDWSLNRGLNILIGENDSGKTAVVDAFRFLLWTTSFDVVRLSELDFHVGTVRANSLSIEAKLVDLSDEQEASVLEWLSYEPDGSRSLILNLQAKRVPSRPGKRARIEVVTRSGENGCGPELGSAVRDLVRATYLRPLRDAEAELRPSRNSRLSQILAAYPGMDQQDANDYDSTSPGVLPKTIVGLMAQVQDQISGHTVVGDVTQNINDNYLNKLSVQTDLLAAQIQFAANASLSQILERFELSLDPPASVASGERCIRGLGYNNALFMAAELLLLRTGEELGLLLVEEPEAHLHPQLQERVVALLQNAKDGSEDTLQVVLTTHSPTIAAGAAVESMALMVGGRVFSLEPECTNLEKSDYEYLRRFLDATKANLFFARGVAIVEGPAEALLLPAIAEAAGVPFARYGVSVVNVGDVGLYHYARVFQRSQAGESIGIPVACITDRDVVPDAATYVDRPKSRKRFASDYRPEELDELLKRKRKRVEVDWDSYVRVFVSDHWTLEYDLARCGLAKLVYVSTSLARASQLVRFDEQTARKKADDAWNELEKKGLSAERVAIEVYQPLQEKSASKAVTAQFAAKLLRSGAFGVNEELLSKLPDYLREALLHVTGTTSSEEQEDGAASAD